MACFIYFVALILAVHAANGLQCYSCNSKDSTVCSWRDSLFTYNTEQCLSAGVLDSLVGAKCYKITAKNEQGGEYIARGCLNPPAIDCSALSGGTGWLSVSDVSCVTCDTDKCNSASKITGITLLGIIFAACAFLF